MPGRIGREYLGKEPSGLETLTDEIFPTDGRRFFVDSRTRLREALATAALVLMWAAAIVTLVAAFWKVF